MHIYTRRIGQKINVLILCKGYYKILLKRTFWVSNTSTSLQTTLAADAHLAEGQFLYEKQTLHKANSLMYRVGTQKPTIFKIEQNLELS
jgi:hypothetical protein